jgi:hypothetical protein
MSWIELDDGIIDFSKKAGVKAEDLPTEEEAKEIKEEIEALPTLGWLNETTMGDTPLRGRGAWLAYATVMQGVPPGETPFALREGSVESEPKAEPTPSDP